jgi:hypothetical protein
MIEFIPFGLLLGVPVGFGCFVLARRKGRATWAWGLSIGVLATLWLAGAAAIPSIAGGDRSAAMPVVFLMAGCLLVQVGLLVVLLSSGKRGTGSKTSSEKRVYILLAILGGIFALSLLFAYAL